MSVFNTNINMYTSIKIEKCIKKTKTKGWTNVKEGNILNMKFAICSNHTISGIGQSYIEIKNISNGETFESSLNEVSKMLENNFLVSELNFFE